MKRLRWGRIIILVIILILLILAIKWAYTSFVGGGTKGVDGNTLPEGAALSIPDAPLTPSNMTEEQKQEVVNKLMQVPRQQLWPVGKLKSRQTLLPRKLEKQVMMPCIVLQPSMQVNKYRR